MKLTFTNYKITSQKVQKHIRIMQISDLHDAYLDEENMTKIYDQNADICIATGDMIDLYKKMPQYEFIRLCKNLNIPILYSFGNHEIFIKKNYPDLFLRYKNELLENNCIILDDNKYEIFDINFYGLTLNESNYYKWYDKKREECKEEKITKALGKPDLERLTILLAHNPFYFSEYEKWGADLIFSGHVHGGIVKLPLLGGLLSPERKFFPKYYEGKYEKNFAKMYVSRGIGQSKLKIRINNKPQIIVADINKY